MKANEVKLESDKRRLKEVLDASESRTIKLELQRRSLEGELQRSRLGLSDREAQAQVLQDRVDTLQRQVGLLPHLQAPHLDSQCQVLCRHYVILQAPQCGIIIILTSQMDEQRLREVIAQDHIAKKRQSQN